MNLIFIYGPPATGKLTIAKELSKRIGYPIFHNHLTRDLVSKIYPVHEDLEENYELVSKLRIDVMEYCAKAGTDIIFTYVYGGPFDDETVDKMVNAVSSNGGSVLFVELMAPTEVLLDRMGSESRREHNKMNDAKELELLLKKHPFGAVQYDNILTLDTGDLTSSEAAKRIISHYHLSPLRPL